MTALSFSVFALALSVVSLAIAINNWLITKRLPRKSRTESLAEVCFMAASYAEKIGGTAQEKLRHATEAGRLLCKGLRLQFTDAEFRVGIESALRRL